jgi:putative membrane protein
MQEPELEDATRRTRLANERTYLAWWRSGLTALAVSFGVDEALRNGRYAPFDDRAAVGFTVAGLLLGLATILVVIFQS